MLRGSGLGVRWRRIGENQLLILPDDVPEAARLRGVIVGIDEHGTNPWYIHGNHCGHRTYRNLQELCTNLGVDLAAVACQDEAMLPLFNKQFPELSPEPEPTTPPPPAAPSVPQPPPELQPDPPGFLGRLWRSFIDASPW